MLLHNVIANFSTIGSTEAICYLMFFLHPLIECDYAFQLSKNIIPVMMERNYRPDGWLGILLGTKLWTDFTDLCLFEVKMNELCARLGNSCSSTEKQLEPSRESPLNAGHGAEVDHFHGIFCLL